MRSTSTLVLLALLTALPAPAATQALARLRVIGHAAHEELFQVRGAVFMGPDLVALTAPGPAVHLFTGVRHQSWGEKGAGPAQLTNPQSVAVAGDRILVRDSQLRKIAGYDRSGRLVSTRPLPAGISYALVTVGRDTVLGLMDMQNHAVVRLRGQRLDTILHYPVTGATVRLSAPGSPSLTLALPYQPEPVWAVLADGRIAFWDGRERYLRLLDRSGRLTGRLALPATRHQVTAADREEWFQRGFPAGIRGRDVFGGLREKARKEVAFPASFPAVLSLVADPAGGVWVMQTPAAAGQRWVHLAEGQAPRPIRLPPRRTLLAVGVAEVAVHTRDQDDVESIEIYRKPQAPRARSGN